MLVVFIKEGQDLWRDLRELGDRHQDWWKYCPDPLGVRGIVRTGTGRVPSSRSVYPGDLRLWVFKACRRQRSKEQGAP